MVRSLAQLVQCSKPSAFHHLLASLAQEGRLLRLYTQNVDCIDTSLEPLATNVPLNSRGPWPRTIQLHGGLGKMVCQKCNHLSDFEPALFEGPIAPTCRECETIDSVRTTIAGKRSHGVGKLRPRIVLYNEHNPDDEAIGAVTRADLRSRPDAVIVVGTSLKVPGVRRIVREMCGVVRGRRDGVAIWVNPGAEPVGREFEDCWDLVVRSDSDTVARLAKMKRWDGSDPEGFEEVNEEAWAEMKAREDPVVIVESPRKSKAVERDLGVLTPVGSPQPKNLTKVLLEAKKAAAADLKSKPKPKAASQVKKGTEQQKPATTTLDTLTKVAKVTKPAAKKAAPKKAAPKKPTATTTTTTTKASPKINTVFKPTKASLAKAVAKSKAEKDLVSSAEGKKTAPPVVAPTPPASENENRIKTKKPVVSKVVSSVKAPQKKKPQTLRLHLNPPNSSSRK